MFSRSFIRAEGTVAVHELIHPGALGVLPLRIMTWINCGVTAQAEEKVLMLFFSNSLIIHDEKTKNNTTVKEVWKCGLNYHTIW